MQSTSHEDFIKNIKKLTNGEFGVEGDFIHKGTKLQFIHNNCGRKFLTTPFVFKKNPKCKICEKEMRSNRYYVDKLQKEIKKTNISNYLICLDYSKHNSMVTVRHLTCGNIYKIDIKDFKINSTCPQCIPKKTFFSKGEKSIFDWLSINKLTFTMEKPLECQGIRKPLRFDFFVQGVAIEFDGKQHFEPIDYFGGENTFQKTNRYDRIKDKYCADNGIPLIRIPYWDFDNIDAILTQKLLPLLEEKEAI